MTDPTEIRDIKAFERRERLIEALVASVEGWDLSTLIEYAGRAVQAEAIALTDEELEEAAANLL